METNREALRKRLKESLAGKRAARSPRQNGGLGGGATTNPMGLTAENLFAIKKDPFTFVQMMMPAEEEGPAVAPPPCEASDPPNVVESPSNNPNAAGVQEFAQDQAEEALPDVFIPAPQKSLR